MASVIDTTNLSDITTLSSQRKLVKTTSDILVLFARRLDGSDYKVSYKTSSNNGSTWSSWVDIYSAASPDGASSVSIYIDTNDDILVTWHRGSGHTIQFVKLTDNGDGTWSAGTTRTVDTSVSSRPVITRRSNGDIWIAATSSSTNKVWAYASDDEGATWTTYEKFSPPYNTPERVYILPKGADIWIIIRNGTRLDILIYSGSWGSANIATGLPSSNGTLGGVKVSDSEIYVATNTASGIKLYKYTSSWDAGTLLSDNANDTQPTMAWINNPAGDYLILAWKDYDGSNYDIVYRKYISSWESQVSITTDVTLDAFPSLIETDTHTAYIIWTKGDGNPYSLMFEALDVVAQPQLTPDFEWIASKVYQVSPDPEFQWKTIYGLKFCPNLINFDYYWNTPSIAEVKIPITVYGCLYAYSFYIKNTGSAGSTEIKIYINDTLKKTITIAADGNESSDVYYFGNVDELEPLDYIKVQITGIATGAEELKLNIYQMSFPFKIDVLMVANEKNNFIFRSNDEYFIFNSADNWIVEFNQPIESVAFVRGLTSSASKAELSYSIVNGYFKNSRIEITPHTTEGLDALLIKVRDKKGEPHTVKVNVGHQSNFSNLTDFYSEASITIDTFIPADYYRYSFDGGTTWTNWATVTDNSIILDFSSESEGSKNLQIQYRMGTKEFTESKTIFYLTSTIDCNVNFTIEGMQVFYYDTIPLYAVEVYGDGNLVDVITPTSHIGFTSVTKNEGAETISIVAGTVYYQGEKYTYTPSTYTLLADVDNGLFWKLIFAFNINTKEFGWHEYASDSSGDTVVIPDNLYVLYSIVYEIQNINTVIDFMGNDKYTKLENIFINTVDYTTVLIRIKDTAGRSRDFSRTFTKFKYGSWKTLTVKDGSNNTIKAGQIHSETNLTFTINYEDVY